MSKSLRDLNWSLLIVNLLGAVAVGAGAALAGNMGWKGALITIGACVAKDTGSFFSQARRVLEGDSAEPITPTDK